MPKRNCNDTGERLKDCIGSNAKIKAVEENATNSERKTTSLLDLNAYCLLELFRKLHPKERIHCAVTCRSMLNFYLEEIAPTYTKFSRDDIKTISKMDPNELILFLKTTAPFIEEVDIIGCALVADFVKPLFHYGVKIKKVNMQIVLDCEKHNMDILLTFGQSVENLSVWSNRFQDDNLKEVKQLPNLRSLNLFCPVTGKYFATFCNLEELYLDSDCLQPEYLQEMAKCCTKLRLLHVGHYEMDVETSHVIAQHCHELETLGFETYRFTGVDLSALAKLPKLRRLWMNQPSVSFLAALAEHRAAQLDDVRILRTDLKWADIEILTKIKNLKILYLNARIIDFGPLLRCSLKNLEKLAIARCETLQDDILLEILKGCTNLKRIAVISCKLISKEAVFGCVDILTERWAGHKEKNGTSCKPFVFFNRDLIHQDKRFLEESAILKLDRVGMHYGDFYLGKKGIFVEP